ncbi:MAG: DNA polymerase Y family protein [Acidimicrobiia bacterium]
MPVRDEAVRTLVALVPDWPVVAAGVAPAEPAAVFVANRVMAANGAARAEGVASGMRRRDAQGRCPGLAVLGHDPARDARAFEPVVAALDPLTPRVEVTEPGRCAFPTRGPSRWAGGDEALAGRARALVQEALGDRAVTGVGVADGPFAAGLAALSAGAGASPLRPRGTAGPGRSAADGSSTSAPGGGGRGPQSHGMTDRSLVIPPGASPGFLAPFPLAVLLPPSGPAPPELIDVFGRLGWRTLGDLAAVPAGDVLGRFGLDGATAHRLAAGLDRRPPATRRPAPDLAVEAELDPPAERVDAAAFVARSLAEQLHTRLARRGQACTRLLVGAETEHGEVLERRWRDEGALTAGAIAARARWQLDGWLNGPPAVRPTAGIARLRLVPEEVVAATGRQLGFWGTAGGADERALRALARLEGLFGPEAVTVPEWRGGRDAATRVARVAAGAVDLAAERVAAGPPTEERDPDHPPWPGRLPSPSPAIVQGEDRQPVEVVDAGGVTIGVSGRGAATAAPDRVRLAAGGRWLPVTAWAGPWPAEERWWDPPAHRRRARFQVVTGDGQARLLVLEGGRWWLEALYD